MEHGQESGRWSKEHHFLIYMLLLIFTTTITAKFRGASKGYDSIPYDEIDILETNIVLSHNAITAIESNAFSNFISLFRSFI